MLKVVIIDDEAIELDGMVSYIPWQEYDFQVVGSAWNGLEGYDVIVKTKPDIVLTDIKMPVMDGLEMIQKVQKDFPGIHFVILSGYGEYEFTSRAMMLGVKYYILKPFDEKKIMKVLREVRKEIDAEQEKKQEADEELKKLLPYAKERFFETILTEGVVLKKDLLFYKRAVCPQGKIKMLVLKEEQRLDQLEGFVLRNIIEELLGAEQVLLSAMVDGELVLLIQACDAEFLNVHIRKLKREYRKFSKREVAAAVSRTGDFVEIYELYSEVKKLFYMGQKDRGLQFLDGSVQEAKQANFGFLSRFHQLKNKFDMNTVLRECSILFSMYKINGYELEDVRRFSAGTVENLGAGSFGEIYEKMQEMQDEKEIFRYFVDTVLQTWDVEKRGSSTRMGQILIAVYQNLDNRSLSLQWLAKEVLFMNEDYLGKLFARTMQVKFSAFILDERMKIAEQLIHFKPDILVSELAELLGFSSDGQYFSKVFKKYTGLKPSEYKARVTVSGS